MKRILIVDDEPDLRVILRAALEARGYDCEEAEDGLTALDRIEQTPPDLVISDVLMPRMNGWQLMARLSADPERRRLPVILLTAAPDDEVVDRAREVGAVACLAKPVDFDRMMEVVETQSGRLDPRDPCPCVEK